MIPQYSTFNTIVTPSVTTYWCSRQATIIKNQKGTTAVTCFNLPSRCGRVCTMIFPHCCSICVLLCYHKPTLLLQKDNRQHLCTDYLKQMLNVHHSSIHNNLFLMHLKIHWHCIEVAEQKYCKADYSTLMGLYRYAHLLGCTN